MPISGQTCVHLAAMAGHLDVLQTLVFYGADINAREGLCGRTALHVAAARGDGRTATYLLERCAGVAAAARDYSGRTPKRLAKEPAVARLFQQLDSDSESDDDDISYDSDQSLFDKLREGMNPIDVA
ncbi:NF-kappa-B inhibitor cactus [Eumeta japonica]|uniref:NF-kappa-B inhibitor cactus n=1 Tax=Eumeta variegata TaxID=151549 RepID=A0A4C1XBI2_EUMVA|nr:NF-kappa-B inhibitor cactus [Eumeta japonica]